MILLLGVGLILALVESLIHPLRSLLRVRKCVSDLRTAGTRQCFTHVADIPRIAAYYWLDRLRERVERFVVVG